jgi:SNF2 family DNA or RNA helicase
MITAPQKFQYHTSPYAHQDCEFQRSKTLVAYAGFWEMGTGKTKLIIDTIAHLWWTKEIDGVIIVGDKGNYRNWYGEIAVHLHPEIKRRIAHYSSSASRGQLKEMESVMTAKNDVLDFFLLNVESFSSDNSAYWCDRFLKGHYVLMCVDEATSIKNPKAQRTKNVIKMGQRADYRRILTGTPVTQGPLDLFSMCEFLHKGLLGFPNYTSFKCHYAIQQRINLGPNRPSFDKVIGYRNLDDLTMSLEPFSSRITKDECLDLPDKVYQTYEVELTQEQKEAYESLRQTAVLQLEQGLLTSTHVLTTIGKLQQICCGHVKLDDDIVVDIKSNRLDDLQTILETIGNDQKVIIWCAFQRDVELIVRRLVEMKRQPVDYYGKTPTERREENLKHFIEGNATDFVGTAATGGKGITLTCASYVIYYSNSYSLEDRLQSEDRAHRIGQTRNVTYIDLVCRGTVDEKVTESLKKKEDLAHQVLDRARELLA